MPGETGDTIRDTIDFAKKTDPDYAHFYVATPFPGTDFYDMCERESWLISKDWRRYFHGMSDVVSYPGLPAEEINMAAKRAYREFYYRPVKILKEIVRIRSLAEFSGSLRLFVNLIKTWINR